MMRSKRALAMRREFSAAVRIPYAAHVAQSVVKTRDGAYLQALRIGGAGFECADDVELNAWHERLNVLWRNLASPNLSIWTHVIRRRGRTPIATGVMGGKPPPSFAAALADKYRARLDAARLMENELYVATLYRPAAGLTSGLAARLLERTTRDGARAELIDALDACAKLADTVRASLAQYEPELLGAYRHGSRHCSSLLEYLGLLLNGEWQRMPLMRHSIAGALVSSRLFFGNETVEYRAPTSARVGAFLGIKEYPTPTVVGMFGALLAAPFPFVLTQSFAFLTKAAGQAMLQRQYHRMVNAGDFAISQADELHDALDALTSNEFVMGDHHFSLQVMAELSETAAHDAQRLRSLNDSVALARSLLADTGMLVAREDLALEAAFWAQLPGNFAFRPRKAAITSRNFVAMAPLHNYPAGRACGNHWGDALTTLMTSAGSAFHFSLHASDPRDPDGGSRKDTGHTLICGPTGSGKTVFIGFLVAMLCRRGVTQVLFDKDRGLEILVRGLGGEYLPLQSGVPTGFNPLQLVATPENVEFLKTWLRTLAGARTAVAGAPHTSVREQADLDQALRGTLALEPSARRLSRLVEFLDPTDPEGLHARLSRWCASRRGEYAWVFDNPRDSLVARLGEAAIFGFDVTEFLDNALTRAPVTLYLFHLVRRMLDGRPFVCWLDEFWRLLADPAFENFAKDGPKTWRKLNAVICLATQSASDVLDSPISRTLVEQTPTKIFFPNGDADCTEYTRGLGLSDREFKLVKERLEPGSRRFLVKQGQHSVVCQLDLKGFDAELAVISGRRSEVERMHRLIAETGARAEDWLPSFMADLPSAHAGRPPSRDMQAKVCNEGRAS
jgi:type IV secretion system protein VirB4